MTETGRYPWAQLMSDGSWRECDDISHRGGPMGIDAADVKRRLREAEARIAELERQLGALKAAFRANMLRRAQPGENIDAEVDRVFVELGL